MHLFHPENQCHWENDDEEGNLKYEKEECTSHIIDGTNVWVAELVEEGSERFVIFLVKNEHLIIDQTTRQDVQLSQTENDFVDILCDTRNIDWNQIQNYNWTNCI